nr:hypothetical protein Iba_scaffold37660CG0010 [Ipomoea batatas]GMD50214.1 hypothetical protein Iba_chr11aCG10490 [Ipomoea batatas]GME11842.1 hypothetical protein Iba_scaffold12680CG0020 [Ipomoea batatas]
MTTAVAVEVAVVPRERDVAAAVGAVVTERRHHGDPAMVGHSMMSNGDDQTSPVSKLLLWGRSDSVEDELPFSSVFHANCQIFIRGVDERQSCHYLPWPTAFITLI